ncbi:MAG: hypothetical protein AAF311_16825 [Pseudomonadota bacterium]
MTFKKTTDKAPARPDVPGAGKSVGAEAVSAADATKRERAFSDLLNGTTARVRREREADRYNRVIAGQTDEASQ